MKIKNTILLPLLLLMLIGCEKEIYIDYNTIEPLYVIEALLDNNSSEVMLTTTRDMSDSVKSNYITTAIVMVKDDVGNTHAYAPSESGVYQPIAPFAVEEGVTYTLDVTVEESNYTADCYIHTTPSLASVTFSEESFMPGLDMVFCSLSIADAPNCDNYYRYRIRVNSQDDNWSITNDSGQDGNNIVTMPMPLFKEDEEETTEVSLNPIEEGDTIIIDIQSIDRGVYDYFFSLSLSSSNSSNPTSNIDGGCLGYFAAYSLSSDTIIYTPTTSEEGL